MRPLHDERVRPRQAPHVLATLRAHIKRVVSGTEVGGRRDLKVDLLLEKIELTVRGCRAVPLTGILVNEVFRGHNRRTDEVQIGHELHSGRIERMGIAHHGKDQLVASRPERVLQ